ncbi:MAG: hypothetical protein FJ004_07365 [Chloroflexi bacterium]|nr:hypothetical protein [Chloroflexota bacterium]
MVKKLGVKVSKGKVDAEVLKLYTETVAPAVLPNLVRGIMKGVFGLDEKARNRVLEEMGRACYEGFRDFVGTPPTDMDIGSACQWLDGTVPHKRRFEMKGDTLYWEADVKDTYGGCMCILVRLGIIEPRPELCICSTNYNKTALEQMTGRKVKGELVESLNSGAQSCKYKYRFKPSSLSSSCEASRKGDRPKTGKTKRRG